MAINFPDNPNPNDIFTDVGKSWIWDGTTWKIYSSTTSGISLGDLSVTTNPFCAIYQQTFSPEPVDIKLPESKRPVTQRRKTVEIMQRHLQVRGSKTPFYVPCCVSSGYD